MLYFLSSSKYDENFLKIGLNSKKRSSCLEKKPIIVPFNVAITRVPQFKPTNFPKKHNVIIVLIINNVRSTHVLKTDIFIPYLNETAFTKKS